MRKAYRIEFRPSAVDELQEAPLADRQRPAKRIEGLAADPRPRGIKQLDKGIYRLRVGNYRVIDQVQDEIVLVLVLKIGHRQDVCRALFRVLAERRKGQ